MPELPEVETTRRGIEPLIAGKRVDRIIVRNKQLRWPVPASVTRLEKQIVAGVRRRAKYLLLDSDAGSAIIHLGMSGSLRVIDRHIAPGKHDHVDIVFDDETCLRLRDPRRFGAVLWARDPLRHKLLATLGPEPFDDAFDGGYLRQRAAGRKAAVKLVLMDSRVVVGVGNIYASESLHEARIHPRRAAGKISTARYVALCDAVRKILGRAIEFGGTTLRDFASPEGKPGYFRHELLVYGRAGEPCGECGKPLKQAVIGQRSTFFCNVCQR